MQHLALTALAMVIAAFFRPALRTAAFGIGVMYIYATNFWKVHSVNMTIEVILYGVGAVFFLRCATTASMPPFGCCVVLLHR